MNIDCVINNRALCGPISLFYFFLLISTTSL
nr:MAG TPA: hypothetical protein [Caudoviricetes sp.]